MTLSLSSAEAALTFPRLQAFLWMLRVGEGTATPQGYRTRFGGGQFTSLADHPRQKVTAGLGKNQYTSTAAGAYQFLTGTWDEAKAALGLPDFSEHSQDLGAVFLIQRRGGLQAVLEGKIPEAIAACAKEWASLPGSPYGQPTKTLAQAMATYDTALARISAAAAAPSTPSLPTTQTGSTPAPPAATPTPSSAKPPQVPFPSKDSFMTPILGLLLPTILDAIPKLGNLFTSGSKVSERNGKAIELAVNVAKEAVGAVNEQDLVDKLQNDPAAVGAARDAIDANWSAIFDAQEKSVASAREFVKEYGTVEQRTVIFNLTFVELLAVFFVTSSFFGAVSAMIWGGLSDEMKGAIVTLMLIGGWTGIQNFFFGSSRESQQKTELLGKPKE